MAQKIRSKKIKVGKKEKKIKWGLVIWR